MDGTVDRAVGDMKIIIAGSRTITDRSLVDEAMRDCGWTPTLILSGGAEGVDKLGEEWAKDHGIPVRVYPARWSELGRKAGPVRNAQMAKDADRLVAIWDCRSRGTRDMIKRARFLGLPSFTLKLIVDPSGCS